MTKRGEIIGGKYRVEEVIATGGMGIVLRATHLHLREPVAIKILRPDTVGGSAEGGTPRTAMPRPESVARFMREARMTMKLRGEHVVRVFDVDLIEGQLPYIVMELLEGEDLALRIARTGPIAPDVAVEWLLQLCQGVAEAHAIGIVHRDLKPANVFLTRGEVIKVLDFGVSKASSALLDEGSVTAAGSDPRIAVAPASSEGEVDLTSTKTILGSPRYMSPEQMRNARDVDERTDIWAIGAIAHEMLSGDPPFSDTDLEQLREAITRDTPKALAAPEQLRAIVERCLAKDPSERFADVAQLSRALRACTRAERPTWMSRARIGAAIAGFGAIVAFLSWPRAQPSPAAPQPLTSSPVAVVSETPAPASASVALMPPSASATTPAPPRASSQRPERARAAPSAARSADEHLFDHPE